MNLMDTSGRWTYSKTGKRIAWTKKPLKTGDYFVVKGELQRVIRVGKNTDNTLNYLFKPIRKKKGLM